MAECASTLATAPTPSNYPVVTMTVELPGSLQLLLQVRGDCHTLEDVARAMFKYRLSELLVEELDDHLWRFEPVGCGPLGYGMALDTGIPILSLDMSYGETVFTGTTRKSPFLVREGSRMKFRYDERSPTILYVNVDSITPMPDDKTTSDYPLESRSPLAEEKMRKSEVLSIAPVLIITMDEAYPHVATRWLREYRVSIDLGKGCDAHCADIWHQIWGGGSNMAYSRSMECFFQFHDMDEFWWCCEKGIEKQVSPGHPAVVRREIKQRRETGEEYMTEEVHNGLEVVCSVYPSQIPTTQHRCTMIKDMGCLLSSGDDEEDNVVRAETTWSFNHSLPVDWKESTNPPNFSFARQFPKCTKWLTYPTTRYHWMKMEGGVLSAVMGRNHTKKPDNVVHRTLKHKTLHAMFQDMEEQLVLPKSWK